MKLYLPALALALVSCSSSGASPRAPGNQLLVDRIEALENDIAQLHAEMQELRVDYLPVEEMTEDEFNRHVEKRVADLAPEEKAAKEKELRAKRKASTLRGKGLLAYWDERFTAEAEDTAFAKDAEKACRPKIEQTLGQGGKIFGFDCRKERCRVELEVREGPAADAATAACTSDPADAELFASSEVLSRVTGSNSKVRTIFFVVRKGYSMKIE